MEWSAIVIFFNGRKMKQIILILLAGSLSIVALGQQSIDSLVRIGIAFHDEGDYQNAMEAYGQALELNPDSPLANYEMALTCMNLKDYDNCLFHCDKVIKQNGDHLLYAYVVKGSCLDEENRLTQIPSRETVAPFNNIACCQVLARIFFIILVGILLEILRDSEIFVCIYAFFQRLF